MQNSDITLKYVAEMRNEKANLEVFPVCFVSLETTELFRVWNLSFPLLLCPF